MTRKILEVKEIKRVLMEKEVKDLFDLDLYLGNDGTSSFGVGDRDGGGDGLTLE